MKRSLILTLLFIAVVNSDSSQVQSFDYKCLLCKWTGQLILDYHSTGQKPNSFFNVLSVLCSYLGHQDRQVCQGMIVNIGEQLFTILDVANGTISARDICGMILGGSCAHKSKRLYHWSLEIPDLDRNPLTPPPKWPKTSNKTHKILHLSDPHVQLDYTVNDLKTNNINFKKPKFILRLELQLIVAKLFAAVQRTHFHRISQRLLVNLVTIIAICL